MPIDSISIVRANRKVLHTFIRTEDDEFPWVLADPMSIKFARRGADGLRNYYPKPGMSIDEMHHARAMNPRIDRVLTGYGDDPRVHYYELGDGIPTVRATKLHAILDGLASVGLASIDSGGLTRLITARR